MNWEEKIICQLDSDFPRWWILWADHSDLADIASQQDPKDRERMIGNVRLRIARRLFHRIINAAISSGVVTETK